MSHYPSLAQGGTSAYHGGVPGSVLAPGATLVMGGGYPDEEALAQPELGACHHRMDHGEFCGRRPKKGEAFCPPHKPED